MNVLTPADEARRFEAFRDLEEFMKTTAPPEGHFHTAELEDDNAPDGAVVLRDRAGAVTAVMSRAAFEDFLKAAKAAKGAKQPASRGFADPDPMPPARTNRHERRAAAAKARRGGKS